MDKNLFVLTEKDLIKLSIMLLLSVILFGLSGLAMMIFMQWITRQSYAQDAVDKHGISQVNASRLGGFAVLVSSVVLLIVAAINGLFPANTVPLGIQIVGWSAVLLCSLLGLSEDLNNNQLTPRLRFMITAIIWGAVIALLPHLIPLNFDITWLDDLMMVPVLGGLLTVIFCVGFINAVNMADGANGLMPGIMTIAFTVFYIETGEVVQAVLMTTCGIFTIFNTISGRLFLGDAGSYGLGATLVISALNLFHRDVFSAPFLAVLFAYPCIDIVCTIARRRLQGRSVLLPDNDHLHNRIHFHCLRFFTSKTLANSMTGVLIVCGSSGLAIVGYMSYLWPMASIQWEWVFLGQCVAYAATFYLAGIGREVSQHVVDA